MTRSMYLHVGVFASFKQDSSFLGRYLIAILDAVKVFVWRPVAFPIFAIWVRQSPFDAPYCTRG